MSKLFKKFVGFVSISGVGWLLDTAVYMLLTGGAGLPVAAANYISSFLAVSFVFTVSTRKTLVLRPDGLSKGAKYALYVVYQLVLVTAVSFLAQWLAGAFTGLGLDGTVSKLAAKIIITPVTMVMNFFVLGRIVEKW